MVRGQTYFSSSMTSPGLWCYVLRFSTHIPRLNIDNTAPWKNDNNNNNWIFFLWFVNDAPYKLLWRLLLYLLNLLLHTRDDVETETLNRSGKCQVPNQSLKKALSGFLFSFFFFQKNKKHDEDDNALLLPTTLLKIYTTTTRCTVSVSWAQA